MGIFLQYWGGTGYFLAKAFLVYAEFVEKNRKLRLIGWFVYLLGLPAWIILLVSAQNWVATAMEVASLPSIILGIIMAWKQYNKPNIIIDWSIKVFICLAILCGAFYSIYTFHGIRTFSQILEITTVVCYLISIYLLAKRNPIAWIMLMLGHSCMSILMYIQNKPILCIQQIISLIIAMTGFIKNMKKINGMRNGT